MRTLLVLPRVSVPGKPHLRFSGGRWWVGEDIACRITYVWRAQGWADQRNPESLLDHMARVTAVLERKLR